MTRGSQDKKPGKRRGEARLIDRNIAKPGNTHGVPEKALLELEGRWVEIQFKAWRTFAAGFTGSEVTSEAMTDAECMAMFQVLEPLMEKIETDSSVRARRDKKIAEEVVYYQEYLGHTIVIPQVCSRWKLSKTAVSQAVSKNRDEARESLYKYKEYHEEMMNSKDRHAFLARGIEPNFDVYIRRIQSKVTESYITGEKRSPRIKKQAMKPQ
jgi:hypothetical protein